MVIIHCRNTECIHNDKKDAGHCIKEGHLLIGKFMRCMDYQRENK